MTGGCLCGAVRYQAMLDLSSAYYCHCRDCQIGSGSAFHVAVFAEKPGFQHVDGAVSVYAKKADSGNTIERIFCTQCGTPLWWTGEGFADVVILSVSSLDNPEAVSPKRELWTDSAVSWCRIRDGLEQFRGRPPTA